MSGMKVANKMYLRPREKAQRKGVQALSDSELIQLILGSGTVQFSVARISRKIAKLLKDVGGHLSASQLESLSGVGPAKAAQLLASFELSARYPTARPESSFKTLKDVGDYLRRATSGGEIMSVMSLDGSRRLIEKRTIQVSPVRECLREITASAIKDKAAYVVCARQQVSDNLVPTMSDLVIAKDLRSLSQLLGVTSVEYLLYGTEAVLSVMKEVSHADQH